MIKKRLITAYTYQSPNKFTLEDVQEFYKAINKLKPSYDNCQKALMQFQKDVHTLYDLNSELYLESALWEIGNTISPLLTDIPQMFKTTLRKLKAQGQQLQQEQSQE